MILVYKNCYIIIFIQNSAGIISIQYTIKDEEALYQNLKNLLLIKIVIYDIKVSYCSSENITNYESVCHANNVGILSA